MEKKKAKAYKEKKIKKRATFRWLKILALNLLTFRKRPTTLATLATPTLTAGVVKSRASDHLSAGAKLPSEALSP
jgi:hypothetical protein